MKGTGLSREWLPWKQSHLAEIWSSDKGLIKKSTDRGSDYLQRKKNLATGSSLSLSYKGNHSSANEEHCFLEYTQTKRTSKRKVSQHCSSVFSIFPCIIKWKQHLFRNSACLDVYLLVLAMHLLLTVNLQTHTFSGIPGKTTFLGTASQRQRIGVVLPKEAAHNSKVRFTNVSARSQ